MSKPLDLVGLAEISEWLGVSKQAVTNWRGRHDNFPAPIAELKSGPVWLRSEVSIWAEAKGMEVASREPAASGTRACHRPNTVAFTNTDLRSEPQRGRGRGACCSGTKPHAAKDPLCAGAYRKKR